MREQLITLGETPRRNLSSFVPHLDCLYSELIGVSDTESGDYYKKANEIYDYIIGFWKVKIAEKPQDLGSFGRDKNGQEQSALCMDILSDTETTICKWGIKMDSNGERVPKIDIQTSSHPNGLGKSSLTYNIDLTQQTLSILKTNWNIRNAKQNRENISINFS